MGNIKQTFTDQMGRRIILEGPTSRIISLVPSQSELLWDLGLKDQLAGITKFCIHPEEMFRRIPRVGGTKKLNLDKIRQLKPHLIIGNKEENEKEQIEALAKEFPVWMSDIRDLESALEMIRKVGAICGKNKMAGLLAAEIQQRFKAFQKKRIPSGKKTVYVIWKSPLMFAAEGTFTGSMLTACGFRNLVRKKKTNYPVLSAEELRKLKPDLILLSSEPFPFRKKHIPFFREFCPEAQVVLVDGEMFSWYGSRLLKAPAYFEKLLLNYIEQESLLRSN